MSLLPGGVVVLGVLGRLLPAPVWYMTGCRTDSSSSNKCGPSTHNPTQTLVHEPDRK